MNILEFEKDNCQGCYKCIRHCEVKAITYMDNYASVNVKDCVLCGECVNVCPTHAKHVVEDLQKVKAMLTKHERVKVSLAPSYLAYFENVELEKLAAVLYRLGFSDVQETVIGASRVNQAYLPYIKEGKSKHLITSACYSTILLIEKHFPELVDYLIPVDSPMMAHAKMLKAEDPECKVVFIGPCVSKKAEAANVINKGTIDAVLTFEDLEEWMHEEQLTFGARVNVMGVDNPKTRVYPKDQGVLLSIDQVENNKYQMIHVNGLPQVKALFERLVEDKAKNQLPSLFIEAHVCLDSCIGGPILRKKKSIPAITSNYFKMDKLERDENVPMCVDTLPNIHHPYFARNNNDLIPTEEDIQFILAQTGKFTKKDEIDCGACGYATCREKAIAVFQKKADIDMCLPFFRKRAESLSNVIIDHSPNAIFVLNELLEVQEINKCAEELFKLNITETLHQCLPMFIRDEIFEQAMHQNSTIRKNCYYPEIDKICQISVTYVVQHHLFLVIMIDMTEVEQQKKQLNHMRQETIDATSAVIEKQMRVAQEIASLLGETTAQTKVTLTKLKQIVMEEEKSFMKYFVDVIHDSLNHYGEELCGDKVEIVRQDESFIMVLADGLGSGVKANILSTLTSKIIATMLSEGGSIDDAVSTITATLPVCSERNLAYSTFTIVRVDTNGHVFITEFDNPLCVVYRNRKPMELHRELIDVFGKQLYVSEFDAETNDTLVAFSDGVVHAGVGSLLDLGWMYENVVDYISKIVRENSGIRKILRDILTTVSAFYLDKPGDDSTVCVLNFQNYVKATIMVGPPQNSEDDAKVVEELLSCDGYKIVCGGTTSQIVANYLKEEIDVELDYDNPSVPPTAKINGIDLVTEGVLTLGKCVTILQGINDKKNENRLNLLDLNKKDGATRLAKLLCDKCTDVTFLVGRAINPAHQNPDLPISLNLKLQLVKECAAALEQMGKRTQIKYY